VLGVILGLAKMRFLSVRVLNRSFQKTKMTQRGIQMPFQDKNLAKTRSKYINGSMRAFAGHVSLATMMSLRTQEGVPVYFSQLS
jgi:hypothetical protein